MNDRFSCSVINIYKLYKFVSLKYGSVEIFIEDKIDNKNLKISLKNGQFYISKYKNGLELKQKRVDISNFHKIYTIPKFRKIIKNKTIEAIKSKYPNNNILCEFEISELADYAFQHKRVTVIKLNIESKINHLIIDSLDGEAIYRLNGEDISFNRFAQIISKNYIEFISIKQQLINDLGKSDNERQREKNTTTIEHNSEIEEKEVDGKVVFNLEGYFEKVAKKGQRQPNSTSESNNHASDLLNKVLNASSEDPKINAYVKK